eukprot:g1715.t1
MNAYTNIVGEKEEEEVLKTTILDVDGICCASEIPIVHASLKHVQGIHSTRVNVIGRSVTIQYNTKLCELRDVLRAINETGLCARERRRKGRDDKHLDPRHQEETWSPFVAWGLRWNLIAAIVCWSLAFISVFGSENWKYVGLGSVGFTIGPIAKRAYASLTRCLFDIHVLLTLAIVGAIGMGSFVEAAAVVTLFSLSDVLEKRATDRARDAVKAIISLRPEVAVLEATGEEVQVETVEIGTNLAVKAGDAVPIDGVVVKGSSALDESNLTGESRPVAKEANDFVSAGTINVGGGYLVVRTMALSKDSAVAKLVELVAIAQTQRSPTEQLVERVAKVYTPLIMIAALLLGTVPFMWSAERGLACLRLALILLIIGCPCALVISTPIAYVSALSQAARRGILVKGGRHLETLGRVRTIAMDKTGTLTEGNFKIANVRPLNGATRKHVLRLLRAVETCSNHPIAVAACRLATEELGMDEEKGIATKKKDEEHEGTEGTGTEARDHHHDHHQHDHNHNNGAEKEEHRCREHHHQHNQHNHNNDAKEEKRPCCGQHHHHHKPPTTEESFQILEGEGVRAVVDGADILIGCRRMFARALGTGAAGDRTKIARALGSDDILEESEVWERKGGTVVWIFSNGKPVGVLNATDSIRSEAREAVDMLTKMRLRIVMLTGDNDGSAAAVQYATGIQQRRSRLVPSQKKDEIGLLKAGDGTAYDDALVAMVGDGVNDAPALALADVGIAMGVTGTVVAMETADVCLMDNDLRKIGEVVRLGRKTIRKIQENVIISVVSKVVVLLLAVTGWAPYLWLAISADVGAMLVVTLNGLSLLEKKNENDIVCVTKRYHGGGDDNGAAYQTIEMSCCEGHDEHSSHRHHHHHHHGEGVASAGRCCGHSHSHDKDAKGEKHSCDHHYQEHGRSHRDTTKQRKEEVHCCEDHDDDDDHHHNMNHHHHHDHRRCGDEAKTAAGVEPDDENLELII